MYHKITATKLRVLINSENCIELDILFEVILLLRNLLILP